MIARKFLFQAGVSGGPGAGEGGGAVITVHTNASNASAFGLTIPAGITSSTFVYAEYTDFIMSGAATGPADFSNVGALEIAFLSPPPTDFTLQLDSIQTAVPEPAPALLGGLLGGLLGVLGLAFSRRRR